MPLLATAEAAHRWSPALVLTGMVTDCGVVGAGRNSAQGAMAVPPAIETSQLRHDLDVLNGALQSLRDADAGTDLPALYGVVRSDVERLLKAFVLVGSRYEMIIAVGQRRLDSWSMQEEVHDPIDAHDASAIRNGDLTMAMESLLMCRTSYAMACTGYRSQLARVIGTLDHHLALSSIHAVTPAITTLVEGEAEVRSIVADVSAKSKAVIALLEAPAPAL
jgi:hypothetical protein